MPFEPAEYTDAKCFVAETKERLADAFSDKKGFGYISGGVDSTTCSKLVIDAVGEADFTSVHFDHGGMRKDEPKNVLFNLNKECKIPTIFRDYSEFFLKRVMRAGPDADYKRDYGISGSYFPLAIKEAVRLCAKYFVQGTIGPDVIETVDSKLKRQHNVILEKQRKMFQKAGVEVVEPLLTLTKDKVREVARELKLPKSVTERKPFPGPGLYVRRVGQVTRESMDVLREADAIVMGELESYTASVAKEDYQCLCALMDNKTVETDIGKGHGIKIEGRSKITNDKVTGMVNNQRTYTNMLLIDAPNARIPELITASKEIVADNLNKGVGRVATLLTSAPHSDRKGQYYVFLRSILTKDFKTAEVAPISRSKLEKVADILLIEGPESIGQVYYDVTPKPPATIEME
jgi:GMP synthase (glutamine-hydrolysing)